MAVVCSLLLLGVNPSGHHEGALDEDGRCAVWFKRSPSRHLSNNKCRQAAKFELGSITSFEGPSETRCMQTKKFEFGSHTFHLNTPARTRACSFNTPARTRAGKLQPVRLADSDGAGSREPEVMCQNLRVSNCLYLTHLQSKV